MNLQAKLYFSPLGYILHLASKVYSLLGGRCMVYGFWNKDRKYLSRVRISSKAFISDKKKLTIGDNVWIGHYCRIDTTGGVSIGEGCQLGYQASVLSHSSHIAIRLAGWRYMEESPSNRPGYILKPVCIGEYSFIGGGSFILPGVTIGRGCVVGVNSVVTKDIPDFAIVAGSPARIIGSTLDTDKHYLQEYNVSETYYNKTVYDGIVEK